MKLLVLFASFALLWQSQWQEFTSLEGRFKILTPGEMTEKVDTFDTPIGVLALHIFYHQPKEENAENIYYAVHLIQYPEGVLSVDSTELVADFLENTMEQAAESMNGEILYSTDIQLDNMHPGKFWRINFMDGKAVVKSKAYVVGDRFYMVQAVSFQNKNINPDAEKFFDSFKVF